MFRIFFLLFVSALTGVVLYELLDGLDALFWTIIFFTCLAFAGGFYVGKQKA